MKNRIASMAFVIAFLNSATPLVAADLVSQPLQTADEDIRYQHGQASVELFSESGSIQVRPAAMDHGSLTFSIAVYNDGATAANIDVSNFTLVADGKTYNALNVQTLEKKAKSRAAWASFAVALAGGLSAYAAASQRDTYMGTLYTPRGVYQSVYTAPSAVGQVEAAAIVAGTGVGIAAIQNKLDQTLDGLGNKIVQLTTVDPKSSYGGVIVFEKVSFKSLPAQVEVVTDWNGHQYHLKFQVAKAGTPAPAFKPVEHFAKPVDPEPKATDNQNVPPTRPTEPQNQSTEPPKSESSVST